MCKEVHAYIKRSWLLTTGTQANQPTIQRKVVVLEIDYRHHRRLGLSIRFIGSTGVVEHAGWRRRPTQPSIWYRKRLSKTIASPSRRLVLAIVESGVGGEDCLLSNYVNSDSFLLELGRRTILIQLNDFGRPQGPNIWDMLRDKRGYTGVIQVFAVPCGRNSALECQLRFLLEGVWKKNICHA